jgi:hypothetical protein
MLHQCILSQFYSLLVGGKSKTFNTIFLDVVIISGYRIILTTLMHVSQIINQLVKFSYSTNKIFLKIQYYSDWWPRWFTINNNLRAICSPNFSFMGGVAAQKKVPK